MPELKLPDRLRDMDIIASASDASKTVSDAVSDRLGKVDLSKVELPRVELKTPKMDVKVRDIKASRMKDMIPRRSGPNPIPFLIFGVLGGIFVGVWAATSTALGPRIRSMVDDIEDRLQAVMPTMTDRAGDVSRTFQHTMDNATRRAETDYGEVAGSVTSRSGAAATVGAAATAGGGSYAGTAPTTGGEDQATEGDSSAPYGSSGSNY